MEAAWKKRVNDTGVRQVETKPKCASEWALEKESKLLDARLRHISPPYAKTATLAYLLLRSLAY